MSERSVEQLRYGRIRWFLFETEQGDQLLGIMGFILRWLALLLVLYALYSLFFTDHGPNCFDRVNEIQVHDPGTECP